MQITHLEKCLNDCDVDLLQGKFLNESHYDLLIQESCSVYKPNGDILLHFIRDAIDVNTAKLGYENLRKGANVVSTARISAAGILPLASIGNKPLKKDGTLSNTVSSGKINSGVAGYFDKSSRYPYCRTTAYTLDNSEKWKRSLPFVRVVNDIFKTYAPERYAAQLEAIEKTSSDFYIHGTVFTTLTLNKNFRTAAHKDKGDYKKGLGVMSVVSIGKYDGGFLIFPKYRVAVNVCDRSVILADVHEWHGNSEMKGRGPFERISVVFYYREKMVHCSDYENELRSAKNRQPGKLY